MAMTSALGVKAQNASAKPVIIGSAAIDSLWKAIDRYDEIELPPLSVFLATAEQHPSIKTFETDFAAAYAEMALINREWLNYVRFQANYQYGYNSYWSNGYLVEGITYDQSKQAGHSYGVGVSFSLPLGDIFTRKYKRQKQQAAHNLQVELVLLVVHNVHHETHAKPGDSGINNVAQCCAHAGYKAEPPPFVQGALHAEHADRTHWS